MIDEVDSHKFQADIRVIGYIPLTEEDQKRIDAQWELVAKRKKEMGLK